MSKKCVFIGYDEGSKGYRLWVRSEEGFKVVVSKDVGFNEHQFPCIKDGLSGERKFDLDGENEIEVEPSERNQVEELGNHGNDTLFSQPDSSPNPSIQEETVEEHMESD
ncbi:Integrase catalytic domain-containing protein [Abeliophyllum distichum]|uniref:Integrase catalytic domain-containing protein n=1 Tax=Abeliophyllum distichum TaxID=126358 RepID=A0ABD1TG69_9LAMI